MATVLPCSFCDGAEPGTQMITAIATGDTVIVGENCRMMYGLVLAGVTPEIIDDVLGQIINLMEARAGADVGDGDEDQGEDAGDAGEPSTDPGDTTPPRGAPPEDAAPPPPAAPQPAARRPRKTTTEPVQRRRTAAKLAARPDSAKTSADDHD